MKSTSKLFQLMLLASCALSLPVSAQEISGLNQEPTYETDLPAIEIEERGWNCFAGNQGCKDECKEIGKELGYAKTYWVNAYCDWNNSDGPFGAPIPICVCGKS